MQEPPPVRRILTENPCLEQPGRRLCTSDQILDVVREGRMKRNQRQSGKSLSRLAFISLLSIAGTLGSSSPAQAESPWGKELSRMTVVKGNSTGYSSIHITQPVRLNLREDPSRVGGPNADISIRGAGPFAGIYIVPDPPQAGHLLERFFLAGRFKLCSKQCGSVPHVENIIESSSGTGWHGDGKVYAKLPPGDYRLYLLTGEDSAASVAIRLKGVRGKTIVRPSTAVLLDLRTPEMQSTTTSGTSSYVWADKFRIENGPAIALSVYAATTEAYLGRVEGECAYKNEPALPPALSFGPSCMGYGHVSDTIWTAAHATGNPSPLPEGGPASMQQSDPEPHNVGRETTFGSVNLNFLNPWKETTYGMWVETPTEVISEVAHIWFLSLN